MAEENDAVDQLHQRAIEKIRKDDGVWDVKWEFLDSEGNVASVANGTQTNQFVIDERVQQIMIDVPDIDNKSVSHRFYKPDEKLIYWISVDQAGDLWTFVEDPDSKWSKSLPHPNPDGTVSYLRFKPLRETENEVDVEMEMSTDSEQSWQKIFRMYRVRRQK